MAVDLPPIAPPADGWPELTYRYVQHYFWNPQHLMQTERSIAQAMGKGMTRIQAVDKRLRDQEVPLNYLLNVLLRIAPASFRLSCLEPFGIDLSNPGLASLSLRTAQYLPYVQPDVHLESERSRVFMELKVKAPLDLAQVNKYVRLHADLNARLDSPKESYVLLLVKRDPLVLRRGLETKQAVRHATINTQLQALVSPGTGNVTFGATTWPELAKAMADYLAARHDQRGEAVEMLDVLITDVLADLGSRRLL